MSQTRNYLEKVHFVTTAGPNHHLNNRAAMLKLQTFVKSGEPVIYIPHELSTNAEIRLCCELAYAARDYLQHIGVAVIRILYGADGLQGSRNSLLNYLLLLGTEYLNALPESDEPNVIHAYLNGLHQKYRDFLANVIKYNDAEERSRVSVSKNPHIHVYHVDINSHRYPMSDVSHEHRYIFPHFASREKIFTPQNEYKVINPIVDMICQLYTLHYFTTEEGKEVCQKMLELLAEKFAASEQLKEIYLTLTTKQAQPLFVLIKVKCLSRAILADQALSAVLSEDEKSLCDFLVSFLRDDTPAPQPASNPTGYPVQISFAEVSEAMNAYFASKYTTLASMKLTVEVPCGERSARSCGI